MSKQLKLLRIADDPAQDDVGAALRLLRDALAEEAQRINDEGAKAMKAGADPTSGLAPRFTVGAFAMGKDERLGDKGNNMYKSGSNTSDDVVSWQ
jgi:hypothetical protein